MNERITPDDTRALVEALNYERLGHRSKPISRTDVETTALALHRWAGWPIDHEAFAAAGMPLEDEPATTPLTLPGPTLDEGLASLLGGAS